MIFGCLKMHHGTPHTMATLISSHSNMATMLNQLTMTSLDMELGIKC